MKAPVMVVTALAMGALLAGCQSTVPGSPEASSQNPTEPTFPTSRPTRSSPTPTTTTTSTPTVAAPAPAEALEPQNGYVFITTKSGQTRCQISTAEVDCEAPFTNSPPVDGTPANGVRVTSDGKLTWVLGNLGDIPVVPIDYRTYSAQGWTIVAAEDGTRFTNDSTTHGMFVAIGGVDAF
ncbi:hypothetical protein H7K45_10660 [Mycobacterium yunnanensis]|uniref:Lipoprotein LpqJ n=1 Tax=Mycobacterium yunnanensis TaxID=368477 RepID=A0A9X2Z198_9MYCO|nr:hypothetical protein [Mycobacterium yunnanensis]MCV7420999.1 hypothetical protein [Mycobacterium yunnanensis]